MQGLVKIVAFTAPALLLVIVLAFWQQREHRVDSQVETASFDRDWNEQLASFEKTAAGKKRYQQRAAAAQSQYSSRLVEQQSAAKKVDQIGNDLDKGVNSIDAELGKKAERLSK